MATPDMRVEALDATAEIFSPDRPVVMVNLLRFREQADYGDRTEFDPATGQSVYLERYVPAWKKVTEDFGGAETLYIGAVAGCIVGPESEQWDTVALVRYQSLSAFRAIVESRDYLATADVHRSAALLDWRLFATEDSTP